MSYSDHHHVHVCYHLILVTASFKKIEKSVKKGELARVCCEKISLKNACMKLNGIVVPRHLELPLTK